MLWNELLRKGKYSLLQSKSDTQYCVCSNYDETAEEDKQYYNGTYFCYWGDAENKIYELSLALECFKSKTDADYIPRFRLEELCTKFKDALYETDEEYADDFVKQECFESEMKWLGITENEDNEYEIGEYEEEYVPCVENGDYSPSNPWDAPGMSIKDFI